MAAALAFRLAQAALIAALWAAFDAALRLWEELVVFVCDGEIEVSCRTSSFALFLEPGGRPRCDRVLGVPSRLGVVVGAGVSISLAGTVAASGATKVPWSGGLWGGTAAGGTDALRAGGVWLRKAGG